jgi:hypothetical protein
MHISPTYLAFITVTCLGMYALSDSIRTLVRRSAQGLICILGCNKSSLHRVICFGSEIQLKLCTNTKEIVEGLNLLGDCSLLGLDCEWRPKGWKGASQNVANAHKVAVLQLASPKACLIIQLLRATEGDVRLPQNLYDLLSSASVLKVGVGIRDDCQKLANDHGLACNGLVDLRNLARRENIQARAESLQALSAWAGLTLSKDPSVRLSDWAATHLRADQVRIHEATFCRYEPDDSCTRQIRYACEDAVVSLAVVHRMHTSSRGTHPPYACGSTPEAACLAWTADTHAALAAFCAEFRDVGVAPRTAPPADRGGAAGEPARRGSGKSLRDASGVPSRKSDLYHNCRLEAPDGAVLANLDHDRAAWYLRKGLAAVIHGPDCRPAPRPAPAPPRPAPERGDMGTDLGRSGEGDAGLEGGGADMGEGVTGESTGGVGAGGGAGGCGEWCTCLLRPGAIRLLFEPRGRGHEGNVYYTSPKANVCVVCGAAAHLQRYSVVPPLYRRRLPEALKSRSSFDIVLLCTACHQRADVLASALRAALARECVAPLTQAPPARGPAELAGKEARSLAKALLTARDRLPAQRRAHAERVVREYLQVPLHRLSKCEPDDSCTREGGAGAGGGVREMGGSRVSPGPDWLLGPREAMLGEAKEGQVGGAAGMPASLPVRCA